MVWVPGMPASAQRSDPQRAWRAAVAGAAAGLRVEDGLRLRFVLPPQRWVDLDSIVHPAIAGLRDGGSLPAEARALSALLATREDGDDPGVEITPVPSDELAAVPDPGDVAIDASTASVPRPGDTASKRAWRAELAETWDAPPLDAPAVWCDVALTGSSSLLGPLEVVLDALEPVLGRDPRGQARQEFFPNDHTIRWLRVRRAADGPSLALRLGPLQLG